MGEATIQWNNVKFVGDLIFRVGNRKQETEWFVSVMSRSSGISTVIQTVSEREANLSVLRATLDLMDKLGD